MKTPRKLRVLRINDNVVNDSLIYLPLEVDQPDLLICGWGDFCAKLGSLCLPQCELMLIDVQFNEDFTSPQLPPWGNSRSPIGYSVNDTNAIGRDLQNHPVLGNLGWSPRLFVHGKNTGILIGNSLASYFAGSGSPIGIGVHTGYEGIVTNDMSSAMMLAQTLIASSYQMPIGSYQETLAAAVERFDGVRRKAGPDVVPEAVKQYRQGLLRCAGATKGNGKRPITVWVEQASLARLLTIFGSCQSDEELEHELSKCGLEYYDMNGNLDSLSIPSLFVDFLMEPRARGRDFLQRIPLDEVKRPSGRVYSFIQQLASVSTAYLDRVFEFFRKSQDQNHIGTVNDHIDSDFERFLALCFAYVDLYAAYVERFPLDFDPYEDVLGREHPDLREGLGSFGDLHLALLNILAAGPLDEGWNIRDQFTPLSDAGASILKVLEQHAGDVGGSAPGERLHQAFRYDQSGNSQSASNLRKRALQKMLDRLTDFKCLTSRQGNRGPEYLLIKPKLPRQVYYRVDQVALAARLGFLGTDANNPLQRILKNTPGYRGMALADFLQALADGQLPPHLREFCELYLQTLRPELKPDEYPSCVTKERPKFAVAIGESIADSASPEGDARHNADDEFQALVRMQRRLVAPDTFLKLPDGVEIAARNRSALGVGGDGYRILIPSNGSGAFGLLIADISGKGVSALLHLDRLLAPVDLTEKNWLTPATLCEFIHEYMVKTFLIDGRHATLFVCAIDAERKKLRYVNAFHDRLAVVIRTTGQAVNLGSTMPMIGGQIPVGTIDFREGEIDLVPGDLIALVTDGLVESCDWSIAQEGYPELDIAHPIRERLDAPLPMIAEHLFNVGARGQAFDDQTVVLCRIPNG